MSKLLLCEHIQDIALILAPVQPLTELPAPGGLVISDGIVPGHDAVEALPQRVLEQRVEFQIPVAVDAGIGRPSGLVFADELSDDTLLEQPGTANRLMRDAELMAYEGRVVFIPVGSAALRVVTQKSRGTVQPHRCTGAVTARPLHQKRGDGAVHAAAHGYHGP